MYRRFKPPHTIASTRGQIGLVHDGACVDCEVTRRASGTCHAVLSNVEQLVHKVSFSTLLGVSEGTSLRVPH